VLLSILYNMQTFVCNLRGTLTLLRLGGGRGTIEIASLFDTLTIILRYIGFCRRLAFETIAVVRVVY